MRIPAVLLALLTSISVHAATFTVSSSADSGPGTLRQAILDANASFGPDAILFTTPTVVAASSLPDITGETHIDGSVGGGRVDIQGVSTPLASGFSFSEWTGSSDGSSLTHVNVRAYPFPLSMEAEGVTVTDSAFENTANVGGDGNTFRGNTFGLLRILGENNIVEGNELGAVLVTGNYPSGNRIGSIGNGNTIGAVPFAPPGPVLGSVMLTNSGPTFIEGNEIVGSFPNGIHMSAGFNLGAATISGNAIHGMDTGIFIYGLGTPGIAHRARILGNSIYDVGLPIDLQEIDVTTPNGPTPNDPAPDADDGGNHLQNYPDLVSAAGSPSGLTVTGGLTSTPLLTYRIELFGNRAGALDEARTPLATFDVTANAAGVASFSQTIPIPAAPDDASITATATNLTTNETSEVSPAALVDLGGQLSFSPTTYDATEYQPVTLTVVRTGGSANGVTVNYTTVNGTATAPGDYTTTAGMLTFGPGVTSQTIVVPIVLDGISEGSETFTVVLSDPTNGATVGAGTAVVTIAAAVGAATVPAASTWALILLALGLAAIAALRM